MPARAIAQLALDEQVIEDPVVEQALERRQAARTDLSDVRKKFDEAHEAAIGAIGRLELPTGGAARVGRFRVTRAAIASRAVSFETKASSRLRIALVAED
jgi:hypothetical protein